MIDELEWQTRRDRINKRLQALNPPWTIIRYSRETDTSFLSGHAVEEYPTTNGPADYALFVEGRLLGIIEAKKVKVGPQNVLEQAKRYAKGAFNSVGRWNGFKVPFLYATNGETIWFVDVRHPNNLARKINAFHTPEALAEFFDEDVTDRYAHLQQKSPPIKGLRPYQKEAVEAIENAIAARRILFLVDRRALAAQAVRELSAFTTPSGSKFNNEYEVYSQRFRREDLEGDQPFDNKVLPNEYLTAPKPAHTFVYVCTIQRMTINLFGWENAFAQPESDPDFEAETEALDIPIHAFDVIIADECHRGYTARETAVRRKTVDYFDAVKIGLTATPAAHTLALFREVVYRYTTEQAIQDGYLVDYEAVKIASDIRMKGIFLKPGESVGIVDTETGNEAYDELEDEREFPTREIEQKVTAPESNRKIIREIAAYAYQHQKETGRFPKTLIFAANDLPHTSHCDQLVRICKEEFELGDESVKKITGSPSVDRPLQKIREFRNRPDPKIVVTVDMLTTGVDIPPLEFLVFLRPVKSRILWVQMLGRGTRRCPEIHKETVPISQVIENIYQNVDRAYYTRVLVRRLRRIERTMSGQAREQFAAFIPDGDMARFADELPERLKNSFNRDYHG